MHTQPSGVRIKDDRPPNHGPSCPKNRTHPRSWRLVLAVLHLFPPGRPARAIPTQISTCLHRTFGKQKHFRFAGMPFFKHSAPWSERSPCNGYGDGTFRRALSSSKWAIALAIAWPCGLGLGFSSGCFFHSLPCAESSSKRSCCFVIFRPSKVRGRRMRGSSALFAQMGFLA